MDFSELPDETLLRLPDVKRLTGWKRTSIFNKVKDGSFPKPLHLGVRARAWRWGDIRAYLRRIAGDK